MSRLTWGQFKQRVESEGVTDSDFISWIDIMDYRIEDIEITRYCGMVEVSTYKEEERE